MKFTIVTPCRNAESLIADTVRSVVNQSAVLSGRVELDYAIYDGASTDGTLAAIRRAGAAGVSVYSAPDTGMYDALAHGLRHADGDWIAYLNAGDMLAERALDTIADVAENHDVQWITGLAARYSERGAVTHFSLPFRYRRSLMIVGQYTRRPPYFLPWIQQESTFWRGALLRLVDLERLSRFRLAGDAYLWSCFAAATDLHIVAAQLGGFRHHRLQLSDEKKIYKDEVAKFAPPPRVRDAVWALTDNILWYAPPRVKKMFNRELMLQYDFRTGRWA